MYEQGSTAHYEPSEFDAQTSPLRRSADTTERKPRDVLWHALAAVRGLQNGRQHRYYASFFDEQAAHSESEMALDQNSPGLEEDEVREIVDILDMGLEKREPLNEEEIESVLTTLLAPDRSTPVGSLIARIGAWIDQASSPEDALLRVRLFERTAARVVDALADSISFSFLVALSEVKHRSDHFGVEEDLAVTLERTPNAFSVDLETQIEALVRIDDPRGNFLLHKILDFFKADIATLQNIQDEEVDERGNSFAAFAIRLSSFAGKAQESVHNYILRQHFRDIYEMIRQFDRKEGAISGTAGGASDEKIYTFRRLQEAYDLRLRLGIREGYPVANVVLPIAPGYAGLYKDGRLYEVFAMPMFSGDAGYEKEKEYIEQNNPDDEYIYDILNEPMHLTGRFSHPSNKLRRLQDVWDFNDHLKETGRHFFYDLSRVDRAELHPMVYADLLTSNQEYIHRVEGTGNDIAPIPPEEYNKALFPAGNPSSEQEYGHRYLMSLHMRKTIEDNFTIDLAEIPLRSQVQFLNYLNRRTASEVERLQEVLTKHADSKKDILISFLSCAEDPAYADTILTIADRFPSSVVKMVFGKYAEVVAASEDIRDYLIQTFGVEGQVAQEREGEVVRSMVNRGNVILQEFAHADGRISANEAVAKLDRLKISELLFANTFRAVWESGDHIEFNDIRNADFGMVRTKELSTADREAMEKIYADNYAEYPEEFRSALLAGFRAAVVNPDTVFYIFRQSGVIVAFDRFDKMPGETKRDRYHRPHLYFGSFNVNKGYRGAKIGEAMIEQTVGFEPGVLHADCNPREAISTRYIEHAGFVVTGQYKSKGVESISILRDKDIPWVGKQLPIGDITRSFSGDSNRITRSIRGQKLQLARAHEWSELPPSLFAEGYVMSRYFSLDGMVYAVYEKPRRPEPSYIII